MTRILVIKLGALGDFILSWRAMTAIRAHHRDAHITLLTIPPMRPLAEAFGLFDDIWYDERPKALQIGAWWRLQRRLNGGAFDRVYDLQTADRTAAYFRLMGPPFAPRRPEWSGIVRGCSHRHDAPDRTSKHTLERQADQLAVAGIGLDEYPPIDTTWVRGDISRFGLGADESYVLFVPGGSAAHPEKRWPAARYAGLAAALAAGGLRPVALGARAEAEACAAVGGASETALDLCDRTSLIDIMALARHAAGAVGNDTGPMHLIAVMGCPSLVLYSAATRPHMTRPRGPYEGPGAIPPPPGESAETVATAQRDDLATLTVAEALAAMKLRVW